MEQLVCRRHTYVSSGVNSAGSRVNCGSKLHVKSSLPSNVGTYGGITSF